MALDLQDRPSGDDERKGHGRDADARAMEIAARLVERLEIAKSLARILTGVAKHNVAGASDRLRLYVEATLATAAEVAVRAAERVAGDSGAADEAEADGVDDDGG